MNAESIKANRQLISQISNSSPQITNIISQISNSSVPNY